MTPKRKPEFKVGLEFTSRHFSADAKIIAIREYLNQCDVQMTQTSGDAFVMKDWDFKGLKGLFESGEYTEKEPDNVNINFI